MARHAASSKELGEGEHILEGSDCRRLRDTGQAAASRSPRVVLQLKQFPGTNRKIPKQYPQREHYLCIEPM